MAKGNDKEWDRVIPGTCITGGERPVTEGDIRQMAADLDADEIKHLIELSLLLLQRECLRTVKKRKPLCEEGMALWGDVFAPAGIDPVSIGDNVTADEYEKFLAP